MAEESSNQATDEQVESLIDDLIGDIFNESRASESSMRGMAAAAALMETAFGSGRGASRASVVERILVAEAFAAELADALAPALAEQLAPRLMNALEQVVTQEAAADQNPASSARSARSARSSGHGRRSETK
jgi:hypothetical protein